MHSKTRSTWTVAAWQSDLQLVVSARRDCRFAFFCALRRRNEKALGGEAQEWQERTAAIAPLSNESFRESATPALGSSSNRRGVR